MPDPLPVTPPVVHTDNVLGSPITTIAGICAGVAQYLATQGTAFPHDTQGWVQFGLGLVLAIAGALVRQPGK